MSDAYVMVLTNEISRLQYEVKWLRRRVAELENSAPEWRGFTKPAVAHARARARLRNMSLADLRKLMAVAGIK